MNALLLVAHGSRRVQSNEEVKMHAHKLRQNCSDQYDIIQAAFLEIADPLIPDGIKECIDYGATSITVLPYFLNSGRHVIEDIPNIVDQAMKQYPKVSYKIASHLGASDLIEDLLISTANAAK